MRRLKILFVTPWYPTKEQPVAGVFVREHAKAVRLYDDIVVLHSAGLHPRINGFYQTERESDESITESIPTFRVWYRYTSIPKTKYLSYIVSVLKGFQYVLSNGFRPDILHAHVYGAGMPTALIGRLYKIPVVITEHFTGFKRKVLSRTEILKAMIAFRMADMVLPVSSLLKEAIEVYGIQAKFEVVPNVVDTALFSPNSDRDCPHNPKRILFVGLLDASHKKGIPYLLAALARLQQERKDWVLSIVGDGPARAEYEQLVVKGNIAEKVTFHGLRTKIEIATLMRQADLFVLPSVFETFSIVTAEALASGIPVLITRCGGPEEFVTEDSGLVVPSGDEEALCRGLEYMLDHLSNFSSTKVADSVRERFSSEHVGKQLHSIYMTCLIK